MSLEAVTIAVTPATVENVGAAITTVREFVTVNVTELPSSSGGGGVTSYVDDIETLPDYPGSFPPDLTDVTPGDIGAANAPVLKTSSFTAVVGGVYQCSTLTSLTITDPPNPHNNDWYVFEVLKGETVVAMEARTQSSIPVTRFYNSSAWISLPTVTPAGIGAVPTSRTIGGQDLSANRSLADIGAASRRVYQAASFTAAAYGRYHVKGSATADGSVVVSDPTSPAPTTGDIFDIVVLKNTYVRIGGVNYYGSRFPIEREYNGSSWDTLQPYSSDAMTAAGGLTIGGTLTINSTTISWGTGAQTEFLTALGALPLAGGTMTGGLMFTDNALDIGASGATRPRTGYFGTSLIAPTYAGSTAAGASVTLQGNTATASGTNIAGGNVNVSATPGTGTGASTITFSTGTTLGTGTTLQTLSAKVTILGSGNVGVGTTAPLVKLHVSDGNAVSSAIITGTAPFFLSSAQAQNILSALAIASDTATQRPIFSGYRARGTLGSPTTVVNGDTVFSFLANGYDGTASQSSAQINFNIDGAVSSGVVPMSITFMTGTSSATRADRLTVASSGSVGVGTTTPSAKLAINGGCHVGGDSDPGDNNLAVDGTLAVTGATTLGAGTSIKNIRHGVSGAMTAGVITVTDTGCTTNTRYVFTTFGIGTITIPATYYASTRTPATSFVITSNQITDTSTVHWVAIEP